jgi:hypothetical protein
MPETAHLPEVSFFLVTGQEGLRKLIVGADLELSSSTLYEPYPLDYA